jgi:hypothetical protein
MLDTSTVILLTAIIICLVVSIAFMRIYSVFRKDITTIRADYLDGVHGIPAALEKAAEQDNVITLRNADLNRQNRILEGELNALKERNDELLVSVGRNVLEVSNLTKELNDTKSELEHTLTKESELHDKIYTLQLTFQSTLDNYKDGHSEHPATIQPLHPYPEDLKQSITGVLQAMGTPVSAYETGVYNGIVALGNTLFDETFTQVPLVPKASTTHKESTMPMRDAKGKFIKKAASPL